MDDIDLNDYFDGEALSKNLVQSVCHYIDDDDEMCGAYAEEKLWMPEPIPHMPLCKKHLKSMADSGWSDEDSYLVVMGYLYEGMVDDESGE